MTGPEEQLRSKLHAAAELDPEQARTVIDIAVRWCDKTPRKRRWNSWSPGALRRSVFVESANRVARPSRELKPVGPRTGSRGCMGHG